MKIGDFSKLTKVSVRMLRYYDKEEVLKPKEIDEVTGHRSYSISQVPLLQKIIMLRDLNFSISEIKAIINAWDKNTLLEYMEDQLQTTNQIIEQTQERSLKLQQVINHIHQNNIEKEYAIIIKSIPAFPIISLRRKMKNHFEEEKLWEELYNFVKKQHISIDQTRYNNIAIYHDTVDESIDIEVAFIVKKETKSSQTIHYRSLEEVHHMASMMVYGSYKNIDKAYHSFVEWLSQNTEYSLGETSRQITIIDGRHTKNESEYLTEIQIPLLLIK
ncbi:hypothetical protein IGI37_000548 [Enterococcus sp. AZ194]|uniref:MerR family transcriptional regulator n=1 Tax=Enterococcus sp. AZ194 TaxID=2774629 RepID=UPI003F2450CA